MMNNLISIIFKVVNLLMIMMNRNQLKKQRKNKNKKNKKFKKQKKEMYRLIKNKEILMNSNKLLIIRIRMEVNRIKIMKIFNQILIQFKTLKPNKRLHLIKMIKLNKINRDKKLKKSQA